MAAGAAVPAKAGRLAGARFEEGWAVVHGDENNAGWAEIARLRSWRPGTRLGTDPRVC